METWTYLQGQHPQITEKRRLVGSGVPCAGFHSMLLAGPRPKQGSDSLSSGPPSTRLNWWEQLSPASLFW